MKTIRKIILMAATAAALGLTSCYGEFVVEHRHSEGHERRDRDREHHEHEEHEHHEQH